MRERKNRIRVQEERRTQVHDDAPLERKASGEVLDELLLMEMALLKRYKAHLAAQEKASRPAPKPAPTPEKERILRALRRLDKRS